MVGLLHKGTRISYELCNLHTKMLDVLKKPDMIAFYGDLAEYFKCQIAGYLHL